jgi:hypothetical protein
MSISINNNNGIIEVSQNGSVPKSYFNASGKFYPSGSDNILLIIGLDSYDIAWENLIVDGIQANSQFGALLLLEQFFAGLPLQLPLRLNNVLNSSTLSDWNTFFGLPTYGTPFSSIEVVGNEVRLFGGSNIDIREGLFDENNELYYIIDENNCAITLKTQSFNDCVNLHTAILPAVTSSSNGADGIFLNCYNLKNINLISLTQTSILMFCACQALEYISLPNVATVGGYTFFQCSSLKEINLESCTNLGGTVGDNNVFYGISDNNITLTIPSALMTCNGGLPDGDIQYLQANNNVTIITV